MDEDNKGYVSVKNLINAMKNKRSDLSKIFGPQRSEKALEKFAMLDSTGDGRITFAEFSLVVNLHLQIMYLNMKRKMMIIVRHQLLL